MSYQPTPETERIKGALHTNWNDLMNHARKLERERDEAMELLASEKITRNHIIKRSVEVERERDEALEVLREMWASGDAFLPYIDEETTNRWRKAAGWEETK